jgi:hypothetical protein
MTRPELTGVPGVPEVALAEALVARLPANLSEAPWECRCEAVVWAGRGGRAARLALPPGLRRSRALASIGGFVRYQDTPVGEYDEVLGLVASHSGLRPWGSVAFLAVDSETSLVGGRTNWAMPKGLARFDGRVGNRLSMSGSGLETASWGIDATPRVIGPRLPLRTSLMARQQFPDGSMRASKLRVSGTFRPALVRVAVESEGRLASWMRPGWHLGAVVESMSFSLGVPGEVSR